MYEQHFGLKRRPFLARATGGDVFVGPQTADTMAGLKKALSAQDAVVAVSGPAGVGKTTLVAKALEALSDTHRAIRIGRMQLDGTDALEFLLEELGTGILPKGPIRQFAAFRELLEQLQSSGKRLVIVVEDAIRTGIETLAEIEALTAADAGESGGAAIVIMGDEGVADVLADSQLTRLSQRLRQRLQIMPLSLAELRGYLMHCFRSAGSDFDTAFDDKSADVLHSLSEGVPRVANYVAEAALSAAAADGVSPVPAEMVARIARDEFGLEPAPETSAPPDPVPAADPEPTPEVETLPEPEAFPEPVIDAEPELTPEPILETAPEPEPSVEAEPRVEPDPIPVLEAEPEVTSGPEAEPVDADPIIVFSDATDDEPVLREEDIPELIQDTLPDLEVLAPELAARADAMHEAAPESASPTADVAADVVAADPAADDSPAPDIPTLVADTADRGAVAATVGREADKHDPTIAELKPDLEALEHAMATAQGNGAEDESLPVLTPAAEDTTEDSSDVPKITLDDSIRRKIDLSAIESSDPPSEQSEEALQEAEQPNDAAEPQTAVTTGDDPAPSDAAELERIAAQLANVKSLEDVDDAMAETLFGAEISTIAAEVVANPPDAAPKEPPPASEPVELSLVETSAGMETPANETPASEMEQEFRELYGDASEEVSIETTQSNGGMDLSASQRLATVRALNAGAEPPAKPPPPRGKSEPQPIEDQINTSITQTLKALNVEDIEEVADDAPRKSGFFSRFRKP